MTILIYKYFKRNASLHHDMAVNVRKLTGSFVIGSHFITVIVTVESNISFWHAAECTGKLPGE